MSVETQNWERSTGAAPLLQPGDQVFAWANPKQVHLFNADGAAISTAATPRELLTQMKDIHDRTQY